MVEQLPHCDLLRLILLTERFVLSARQVFPYSQKDVFAFMHAGCHCSVSVPLGGIFQLHFSVVAHVSLLSFNNPASKKEVVEKLPQSIFCCCACVIAQFQQPSIQERGVGTVTTVSFDFDELS